MRYDYDEFNTPNGNWPKLARSGNLHAKYKYECHFI